MNLIDTIERFASLGGGKLTSVSFYDGRGLVTKSKEKGLAYSEITSCFQEACQEFSKRRLEERPFQRYTVQAAGYIVGNEALRATWTLIIQDAAK